MSKLNQINQKVYAAIRAAILENANSAGEIGAALLYQKTGLKGEHFDMAIEPEVFKAALRQMAADKEITVTGQVVRFTAQGRKFAEGAKPGAQGPAGGKAKAKGADATAGKRQNAARGQKTAGRASGGKAESEGPKSETRGQTGSAGRGAQAAPAAGAGWVSMDKLTDAELLARVNAPEDFTAELVARALGRLRSHAKARGLLGKSEE